MNMKSLAKLWFCYIDWIGEACQSRESVILNEYEKSSKVVSQLYWLNKEKPVRVVSQSYWMNMKSLAKLWVSYIDWIGEACQSRESVMLNEYEKPCESYID